MRIGFGGGAISGKAEEGGRVAVPFGFGGSSSGATEEDSLAPTPLHPWGMNHACAVTFSTRLTEAFAATSSRFALSWKLVSTYERR